MIFQLFFRKRLRFIQLFIFQLMVSSVCVPFICLIPSKQSNIYIQLPIIHQQMRTRAQRKMEEQTVEYKPATAHPKKTKKQLLQSKNEQQANAAAGKADGKKKVKDEPAPSEKTRRSKLEAVRVEDKKQSPKKAKGRGKSNTVEKKEEQKKQASVQKKTDEAKRSRKKPSQPAKQSAKATEQSQSKIPAKDDLNTDKEQEKEVIKTIQYKGKAPIDEHCHLKPANHHILEHDGKVYSATLNQTSVANNNNKFYILQIIQADSNPNHCYFFTRWGRVGAKGQVGCLGPMTIPSAIREYQSKYHEKGNKGNYKQVELNFQVDDKKNGSNDDDKPSSQAQKDQSKIFSESKLEEPVKRLVQLIFDLNMMKKQMMQIGYNAKKMPLGQLTQNHIQKGFTILKKLLDQIKGKHDKQNIERLTSDFYTTIPHDFGFSKMSNFMLDTEKLVKGKIEMLEALSEIKVATALIDQKKESENELDSNFKKLQRDVNPVHKDSNEFELINRYLKTTHASTHTSYDLQLVDLFSLNNEAENLRYTKHIDNKMLLWHGSRLTNFVGILSQGLRIAPPQAPVTGYMFGKGVYFADMSSKSANYCFTSRESSTGILLLCQVALGGMNEKFNADYYAANLPPGKHSTKGVGRTAPNPANAVKLDDGVVIPMGPGEPTALACTLLYNEFIVYDVAQIRIRYLLRTRFNYK